MWRRDDKGILTQRYRQGHLVEAQIADSARKHGVLDEDILEVVVLDDDAAQEPVVIHAMPLRSKFRDHLRW